MAEPSPDDSQPSPIPGPPSIAAIIVTRNRLALLQECLAAVRAQERAADEIIVIDNASDDGTREWLESQDGLTVIRQGNLGGAGGFWRGIKEGYARGHDWFWCMDDDTIAEPGTLERLCASRPFGEENTGYLGSMVHWTDGTPHRMNMWLSLPRGLSYHDWYGRVLPDRCIVSETSSFVSILIARRAVEKVGLPLKEMFIWSDDSEYTYRISEHFRNYHVLDSIAVHKTASNKHGTLALALPSEHFKLKHGLRNEVYARRKERSHPLVRSLRLALHMARQTAMLLRQHAPLDLMLSLWSGLFFRPRIERVRRVPSRTSGAR